MIPDETPAPPSAAPLRALVVSNMAPDAAHPARGSFVRDQVAALRGLPGIEVSLHEFTPGASSYGPAALALARLGRFDVVHAHFGLTQWPALLVRARARAVTLHGTDLRHPRTRILTLAALGRADLVATVSQALAELLPGSVSPERRAVLPCGVDLARFRPLPRAHARAQLGLDPDRRLLLFPADPARAVKRHDRALEVAGEVELLTAGGVQPERMPLLVNAADAVLVPSEDEGFGLAVLEALACDVPVLATPVGIHRQALEGVAGTLCAPFDARAWKQALSAMLADRDPRIDGRERAGRWGSEPMAAQVASAWRRVLAARGGPDPAPAGARAGGSPRRESF